jgi:hypothetical protein
MNFCRYEFVRDINDAKSLYRCVKCGGTQETPDDPTPTECKKSEKTEVNKTL